MTLGAPPRGLRTLTLEIRNDSVITSRRLNDVTQIVIVTKQSDDSDSSSSSPHRRSSLPAMKPHFKLDLFIPQSVSRVILKTHLVTVSCGAVIASLISLRSYPSQKITITRFCKNNDNHVRIEGSPDTNALVAKSTNPGKIRIDVGSPGAAICNLFISPEIGESSVRVRHLSKILLSQ